MSFQVGYGPLRVWPGGLALSRAIGDFDVGPSIIASPFIKQLRVPQTAVRIIIASDGVWDACSNAVAAKPGRRADTESAASAIVAGALKLRGLRDDTTVICLDLCPDAEPLGVHWEAQASKRAVHPRAPRPWPCCGGSEAEEWAHEQPVEELVDELRELDFHTVAPAGATAKASSGAPQPPEGLLPRVMPRTSGRLSSRNADNEVSVRPYRDAQAEAAPPGLPPGGMDATEHAGTLAALIMEPRVQAAAGIYVHPRGFLRGVADLCRRHDVLLILDEVAVGFGRTGTMFACEQENVSPDFLCLAKGLTAGYLPMAATLTTERVWNAFLGTHTDRRTFFHGHTYGGNPLAAAVGLASLDVFHDERVLESLPPKIERLRGHVERMSRLDHVGGVRQCGLLAGFDLVADKATAAAYPWQEKRGMRACLAARKHGALLRPLGDVVVIMPPLSITLDEIDLLAAATEAGIRDATE